MAGLHAAHRYPRSVAENQDQETHRQLRNGCGLPLAYGARHSRSSMEPDALKGAELVAVRAAAFTASRWNCDGPIASSICANRSGRAYETTLASRPRCLIAGRMFMTASRTLCFPWSSGCSVPVAGCSRPGRAGCGLWHRPVAATLSRPVSDGACSGRHLPPDAAVAGCQGWPATVSFSLGSCTALPFTTASPTWCCLLSSSATWTIWRPSRRRSIVLPARHDHLSYRHASQH